MRVLSLTIAFGAFAGSMLSNKKYVPLALNYLLQSLSQCCKSPRMCIKNTLLLKFGFIAALILAGVSYNSLLWTPETAAICMTLANFFSTGARRYYGVVRLAERIRDYFSEDAQFQRILVDELHRLKDEPKRNFERAFQDAVPNQETAQRFLDSVCDEALRVQNESDGARCIYRQKTNWDLAYKYIINGALFSAAAYNFVTIIPPNISLGYLGTNVFAKIFFDSPLNFLQDYAKILIGVTPAVVTAIFFAISTADLDRATADVWESIKVDPITTIPKTAVVMATDGCCAIAFAGMANSTFANPDLNVFHITPGSETAQFFSVTCAVASGIVGAQNIHDFGLSNKVPKTGLKALIKFVDRTRLTPKTISGLRRHAHFQPRRAQLEQSQPVAETKLEMK
jgi:hypothetical protein